MKRLIYNANSGSARVRFPPPPPLFNDLDQKPGQQLGSSSAQLCPVRQAEGNASPPSPSPAGQQVGGKRRLQALERIWIAEIQNRLPLQSKAKVFDELEQQGLVERGQVQYLDRFGTITVKGWYLTHAGRLLYCSSCGYEMSP